MKTPAEFQLLTEGLFPTTRKGNGDQYKSNKCPLQMATEKSKHGTISTMLFQLMECRKHGNPNKALLNCYFWMFNFVLLSLKVPIFLI